MKYRIEWMHSRFWGKLVAWSWVALAGAAQADGAADLKSALARLQGQGPLKAVIEAKTWSRQIDGKDTEETQGHVSVVVEEGARGLQVLYAKDLLGRLESEERNKERDPKAKTPTLSALNEVNSSALRPMISAASSLSRNLEKAQFKSEKAETYNGKPARLLNFALSIDKLSEKDRKYVKSFEGSLDVWIAEDGTPYASRLSQTLSGRAFVVVTFDAKNDDEMVYGLVGDRLVTLKRESRNTSSGMGEKGESRVTRTLQVQSS
jgi:hypothetical protein